MARLTLDPRDPPALTPAEQARLAALTDAEITSGAETDPDNPPLAAAELARLRGAARVRQVRTRSGLSQAALRQPRDLAEADQSFGLQAARTSSLLGAVGLFYGLLP